jgi:DNA-binding response OmpR family regulator
MKKILLVEDDPFLIEIYKTKLTEAGFKVSVAIDGQEGIKKTEEENPDLVLLDIVLPNVDGWEYLRKISKHEKFKNLKIVVLSNLGQKSEVEKGMDLGAAKYIIKAHYTPSEVVEEVKKIIQ